MYVYCGFVCKHSSICTIDIIQYACTVQPFFLRDLIFGFICRRNPSSSTPTLKEQAMPIPKEAWSSSQLYDSHSDITLMHKGGTSPREEQSRSGSRQTNPLMRPLEASDNSEYQRSPRTHVEVHLLCINTYIMYIRTCEVNSH